MTLTLMLLAAAVAAPGDCATVFKEVSAATEDNYAGYLIKLPDDETRAAYGRFRGMLEDRAASAVDHDACRDVLETYVGFFADHHLFVASRGDRASPIPALKDRWTETSARDYLRKRSDRLDPVEGFWFDTEGRFAIVHDTALKAGQYVAVRLHDDEIGAAIALVERRPEGYRVSWRHPDWGWQELDGALQRGGNLLTFGVEGWGRVGVENLHDVDPMAPVFRAMGDGIYYLSMPSFMPEYRKHLEKIIADNGESMANASGLIVDVRGNAGGDAIYFPLAPYFFANDITISTPTDIRASELTVKYFEQRREQLGEHGSWLDQPLENMRSKPGAIVAFREGSTDGMPEYPAKPEQVVVLQDRGVGSAAEAFIYHARQSRKVVTMGNPTLGSIDYMQVTMHKVGSDDFQYWFGYPLYFMRSLPGKSINDEGYAPDVELNLPANEWLSFAKEWLSRKRNDSTESLPDLGN